VPHLEAIKTTLKFSHLIRVCSHLWTIVGLVDFVDHQLGVTSHDKVRDIRHAAILRSASRPLYSTVLLMESSHEKASWTTYLRCSLVGETRSTLAPAPSREKSPSKYMTQHPGSLLPGKAGDRLLFREWNLGPLSDEVRQDLALDRFGSGEVQVET
jgi:hypothetical protein